MPMQQLKTRTIGPPSQYMRETRMAKRYRLRGVVTFWCEFEGHSTSPMVGITEDISVSGISFVTRANVDLGLQINLDLYLQSANREARSIHLRAQGEVVRVEAAGFGESKVAARILFKDEPEEDFWASGTVQ